MPRWTTPAKPWTPADVEFVKANFAAMTHAQIGAALGRSGPSVKSYCKTHGLIVERGFRPDEINFIRWYHQKLTPSEMARRLRRPLYSVYQYLNRNGMSQKFCPRGEALTRFIQEKHALGWSDAEIAGAWSELHVGRMPLWRRTVGTWRRKLGLASNALSEHRRRRVAAKTAEQMRRMGMPFSHLRMHIWRQEARALGWPEDLTRPYLKVLEALGAHGPLTRRQIVEICGFKWKGSRASLKSNDANGQIMAHLMARGVVVRLGRIHRDPGGNRYANTFVYSLAVWGSNASAERNSHEQITSKVG